MTTAIQQEGLQPAKDLNSDALQNELILLEISKFLSFAELKKFCRVNKKWKHVLRPIIRRKSACLDLTFNCMKRPLHFYGGLIDTIQNSECGFPCTKFFLGAKLNSEDQYLEDDLLMAISEFVNDLKLRIRSGYFQIQRKPVKCPKLKKLEIIFNGDDLLQENTDIAIVTYFQTLMEFSPGLETLVIDFYYDGFTSTFLKSMNNPQIKNIRTLKIDGNFNDDYLATLAGLGLKLKILSVNMRNQSGFGAESFMAFMKSQSECLEELHLNHRGAGAMLTITFPKMKKLSVLEIGFLITSLHFPGLCYSQQFPMLKHLTFRGYAIGLRHVVNTDLLQTNTVESLDIEAVTELEILIQIARIFPRLKRLKLTGKESVTRFAPNLMKKVKDLTINQREYDHNGIPMAIDLQQEPGQVLQVNLIAHND